MDWTNLFAAWMAGWLAVAVLIGIAFGLGWRWTAFRTTEAADIFVMLACLPFGVGAVLGVGTAASFRTVMRTPIAARLGPLMVVPGFVLLCLAIGAAIAIAWPAHAGDGSVVIPWGDWAAQLIVGVGAPLVTAAVLWGLRRLPAGIREWLDRVTGERVEQLLERAIGWGINAVAGAAHGRTLDVAVGSQVAREALDYAVRHAPALVERIGEAAMMEKILARLRLSEEAAVQPQAAPAPA